MKLTAEILNESDMQKWWGDNPVYVIERNNKQYVVVRTGKCNPKKCKSACCTHLHWTGNEEYIKQFGTKCKPLGALIKKKCKQLCNNKCKRWGRSNFPSVCKTFPHPNDGLYLAVMDKCSFKFEFIGEIIVEKQNGSHQ